MSWIRAPIEKNRALVISDRDDLRSRLQATFAGRAAPNFDLFPKQRATPVQLIAEHADVWIYDLLAEENVRPILPIGEAGPLVVVCETAAGLEEVRALGHGYAVLSSDLSAPLLELACHGACHGNAFLTRLLDAVPDPIFVKDERHTWIQLNEAFCRFMGRPRSELLGYSDFDFFPKEQAAVFWEKDSLVFATGESIETEEQVTDGAGQLHVMSTKKSLFEDGSGRRLLVGVIRSITERKRLERELIGAHQEALSAAHTKASFLATMSHEIRTPMTGVIGMTEILLDTQLSDDQRELVRIIRRSGAHLISIINSILDYSKLEAGKLRLDHVAFNLRDTVEQVLDLLAPNAHQKGLELACELDRDVPRLVRGDPGRVSEVLLNLVGNAIKFTDRGYVLLRLLAGPPLGDNAQVQFEVADSGVGVQESERAYIFEAYAHRPNPHGGTGLGLTISKQLIELMGGRIALVSEPNVGSTFSFRIPFEVEPPDETNTTSITDDLLGERILLTVDHPVTRAVLLAQFAPRGISAKVVGPEDVLSELRRALEERRAYSLMVLDEPAQAELSRDLLERVRFESELAHLPVLVLTTLERTMRAESFRDRHTAFLAKPALDSRLFEAIRALRSD
jgi:two-component system sensor histidine kinase/response regulator